MNSRQTEDGRPSGLSSDDGVSTLRASIPDAELPQSIFDCMARCPHYIDFPTAWAIQHSHGDRLEHHHRCSSVPGWDPLSGPALLCDCSAVEGEWRRIKELPRAAQAIEARRAETGTGSVHESAVRKDAP